jgi:hypothetical protein
MLHLGDEDLIAFVDEASAVRMCDEVDPFGRTAHKDAAIDIGCVDESFNFLTRRFIRRRCMLRKIVHAAMDIRMLFREILRRPVDHRLRDL